MKKILKLLIYVYQWTLGPLLGQRCRFTPTCSNYALQAIEKYGAMKGSFLAIKRIFRCSPRHPGGDDPIP